MPHLRLVPSLPADAPAEDPAEAAGGTATGAAPSAAGTHGANVALLFFQAASGVCLCRACAKSRHPAFGMP